MKNNIFALMRRSIYFSLYFVDLILGKKNPITIYSYHSFAKDNWKYSIDPEQFEKQLDYIKKNYELISMDDLYTYLLKKHTITKPSVVISIDDGYTDIESIKNMLVSRQITPTLFILSNTQQPNRQELANENGFLTDKQILLLVNKGWIIGSHSATHSNLKKCSEKDIETEVLESKKIIEKKLNIELKYFAYPRGKYNEQVIDMVKKAGYHLAFTMDDGVINTETDKYKIPRIGVDRSHTFSEFKTLSSPSVVAFRKFIKKYIGDLL